MVAVSIKQFKLSLSGGGTEYERSKAVDAYADGPFKDAVMEALGQSLGLTIESIEGRYSVDLKRGGEVVGRLMIRLDWREKMLTASILWPSSSYERSYYSRSNIMSDFFKREEVPTIETRINIGLMKDSDSTAKDIVRRLLVPSYFEAYQKALGIIKASDETIRTNEGVVQSYQLTFALPLH